MRSTVLFLDHYFMRLHKKGGDGPDNLLLINLDLYSVSFEKIVTAILMYIRLPFVLKFEGEKICI